MTAKSRAAVVSVASNTTLTLMKLLVGLLSGSVSIVSEAIHSANDLLAALIAWFSVSKSDKVPDEDHQYGHGKIEGLSGGIEASLIVVAGVWIIVEAVQKIRDGGEVDHLGLGTGVMAVSALVNTLVSRHLFRVAKREDSLALEADAHHLSTDVLSSLGVGAGLAVVWSWRACTGGSRALDIVDPIVAIAVALFILRVGLGLSQSAVGHLLDRRLPDEEMRVIHDILGGHGDSVVEWHDLRTRKSGSTRYVEVHVTMDGNKTLLATHAVAEAIELEIARALPPAQTVVHVDPVQELRPAGRAT
jgi:cation diffusion facilitator family transporter